MKRLSLLLITILIFSCNQKEKPDYSILTGTIENNTAETVLVRGNGFESRIPIDDNGAFNDTLFLKKDGLYDLYIGRERTGVYLENGKNISVSLNVDQFDETLKYTGDLGDINNYLVQKFLWNEQNLDYKDLFSLDEEDFHKKLDWYQSKIDSMFGSSKISNNTFKKLLTEEETYSRAALIENYVDAHRYFTGVQDYQVGSDFYDPLKNINFKDTLAYRNSMAYQNLLESHFNRVVNEETYESGNNNHTLLYLKKVDSSLPDGYAKDNLMFNLLQFGLKPDENLEEAYNIYKSSNPNPENFQKLTDHYNKLKNITAGNISPTFDFENHKGGTTSLADLKGKYVYVDVWATWCAPCLREIPFLKEIEKDYAGKKFQVVSISIDEPKDYDKWTGMVTENRLGGIQLMADNNWNSKFVKDYAILGIPRFILLDPDGKIVAADAPRPSDPELKNLLTTLL
ncbi:MAG: TlpA disulfide reductase family protein [Aequorivita sp.]